MPLILSKHSRQYSRQCLRFLSLKNLAVNKEIQIEVCKNTMKAVSWLACASLATDLKTP